MMHMYYTCSITLYYSHFTVCVCVCVCVYVCVQSGISKLKMDGNVNYKTLLNVFDEGN